MKRLVSQSLIGIIALCGAVQLDAGIAVVRPTGTRRALIVGIDDQRARVTESQQRIANVLEAAYGFEPANLRVLSDGGATSKAIRDALRQLASSSRPGDSLFVYLDVPARGEYFIGAGDDPQKPWQSLQLFELADVLTSAPASAIFVVVPTCETADSGAKINPPAPSKTNQAYLPETVDVTLSFCREESPEFAITFAEVLQEFANGSELQIPASAIYRELRQRKLPYVRFESDRGAAADFTFVRQRARVTRSVDLIKGASSSPDKEKAIEDVVRALSGGDRSSPSPEVREVAVLLSNIAASPSEPRSTRLKALWGVGELKSASAIPALERVFENEHNDPVIRKTVVEAVARIGTGPASELVHRAIGDSVPEVRIAGLRAATTLRDPDLTAHVIEAVRDADADVRVAALQGIATIKAMEAADQVLAMVGDPSPQVRREAVSTLAAIGVPTATPAVLELARSDPDESVRQAVVFALGRSTREPGSRDRVIPLLLELTRPPNPAMVREASAWSLGELGGVQAELRLRELLRSPMESPTVRKNAAEGLGKQKSRSGLPELKQAVQSKEAPVRRAAVEALGLIGDPTAFSPLLRALDDPDPYVKSAAMKALENVVPTTAQAREMLKNRDPEVRAAAVYKLGRDPASVREIAELLADEDYRVREAAIQALQAYSDPASLDLFISLLDDKRFLVRQGAATILGRVGKENAVDALRAHAGDRESGVRAETIRALGRISPAAAEETILRGAADVDANVRLAAAEALARINSERAQKQLAKLANDPAPEVRQVAVRALRGPAAY